MYDRICLAYNDRFSNHNLLKDKILMKCEIDMQNFYHFSSIIEN